MITNVFIGMAVSFVSSIIFGIFFKKYYTRPIVMQSDRWQPIETLPEDMEEANIYLSDGKRVRHVWGVDYGRKGKIAFIKFDFDGSKATHWMPEPLPPQNMSNLWSDTE